MIGILIQATQWKAYDISVRLGHIASEDSIIADALSHGNLKVAEGIFSKANRNLCIFNMGSQLKDINFTLREFSLCGKRTVHAAILTEA